MKQQTQISGKEVSHSEANTTAAACEQGSGSGTTCSSSGASSAAVDMGAVSATPTPTTVTSAASAGHAESGVDAERANGDGQGETVEAMAAQSGFGAANSGLANLNSLPPGAYVVAPDTRPLRRASYNTGSPIGSVIGTVGGSGNVNVNGNNDNSGRNDNDVANLDDGSHSHHHVEAYAVEDEPNPSEFEEEATVPEAKVIQTLCGIDRKRFFILLVVVFVLLAVILGSVLGTSATSSGSNSDTCGPLCSVGRSATAATLPDPERLVLGFSCQEWDLNAFVSKKETDADASTCSDNYLAAAYGCGCPNIEEPSDGCGTLCQDGSPISDEFIDVLVKDIRGVEEKCVDWELLSSFDTDPLECPNYHAVGMLCGCDPSNAEAPPDACGPLCTIYGSIDQEEEESLFSDPDHQHVWGQTCEEWNVLTTYTPLGHNNDAGESCAEYYHDVAYRCGCPDAELPPDTCGTLCGQRSHCGLMCQDGSAIPDPDVLVRDLSCRGWEFFARMEPHAELCYFYTMIGGECGCPDQEPREDACGPLCKGGEGGVPYPDREIKGHTCEEWDGLSTFLYPGYGEGSNSAPLFESCEEQFSQVAFQCGCPGADAEPPANGCGTLCQDGSDVPNPDQSIGDTTCAGLDLDSKFETDPGRCSYYRNWLAPQCGCEGSANDGIVGNETDSCFNMQDLDGEQFVLTVGQAPYGYSYAISFGEDGVWLQGPNNGANPIIVGPFTGFGTGSSANIASFGGGRLCGKYGPRRGSVVVTEDETATKPFISSIIEPSICVYKAELMVPKYCNTTSA